MYISIAIISKMVADKESITIAEKYVVAYGLSISVYGVDPDPV